MSRFRVEPREVRARSLPVQVAGVLARRIATGELNDGLAPSELQICREFEVSRAVAREALKMLSSVDMVEISQGRRVVVRPPAQWDYLNPLLMEWLPADEIPQLLEELQEARIIIEPGLAARAAEMATTEDLERLRAALDGMVASVTQPDPFTEYDFEFHLQVCRMTRNRVLERFMYSSRWWQSASRRITNRQPGAVSTAISDHQHVYDAIAAGDSHAAVKEMRRHLTHGVRRGHAAAAIP